MSAAGLETVGLVKIYGVIALCSGICLWGDSISDQIPSDLQARVTIPVKDCAIGGETSAEILARAQGIAVTYPLGQSLSAGTITLRANLVSFPREFNASYAASQTIYRQRVAFPRSIDWAINGTPVITTGGAMLQTTVTADASTDALTATAHKLMDGDRVWVSTSAAFPAPLVAGAPYFVRDATANSVKLAATPDGVAIDLTSSGSGTVKLEGPWIVSISHPGGAATGTLASRSYLADSTWVVWAGANDTDAFAGTVANIAAIVALSHSQRVLVLTIFNNATENASSTGSGLIDYNGLLSANANLVSIYGAHCLDVRQVMLDQYIEGSDDATDHANGVIPMRLRIDDIHMSSAGIAVVGSAIAAKLQSLGWAGN